MSALHLLDRLRRSHGDMLDALGLGPVETPWRTAFCLDGARLRAYGGRADDPILLIVPAPIKRAYIWDLAPEVSVVRRCIQHGWRVFLLEWTEGKAHADLGLADYADRLPLACLEAIAAETRQRRVVLAGHSLGGTLAAVFAALHPERVAALALFEAPTGFGERGGPLASLAAITPATTLRRALGTIPGSLLDFGGIAASSWSFVGERWLDLAAAAGESRKLATHLRVVRWTLDEFPLPGRLFEEVVRLFYCEDRFVRGTLEVAGRTADTAALAMPLLTVVRRESLIIPPASALALHRTAPSRRKRVLRYRGDRGVALRHVGVLVGGAAHAEVWPPALEWLRANCELPPR